MENPENKFSWKNSLRIKLIIILATISLIVLMFPKGESLEFEVTVGSIWLQEDLIASYAFPLLKNKETYEAEKMDAAEKVFPIYTEYEKIPVQAVDSLKKYSKKLLATINYDLEQDVPEAYTSTILDEVTYSTFKNLKRLESILSFRYNKSLDDCFKVSEKLLQEVYRVGLINQDFDKIVKDSIALRSGKYQSLYPIRRYFSNYSAMNYINNYLTSEFSNDQEVNDAVSEYIKRFLIPNIRFNKTQTEVARKEAEDKISRNIGIVNENERIVAKHDRITEEIKLKIDSYRALKGKETGFWGAFLQNLGKFLHVIIVLTIFSIYIYLFRKKVYNNNLTILLMVSAFLLVCFTAFLVQQLDVRYPVEFLVLVPVASMIMTIMFDSRIGFYSTVVISLLTGALRGNDYIFVAMNIFTGALAAYTVRDIKNRTQIFRSFVFILLGYVMSIFAFGLERFDTLENMLITTGFASVNAILSPALTFGLIIFFERLFGINTELTFLELSDFNHPLLKELAKNAPGTFNHSMTIGAMVENASELINANPLLARVGSYYHDIGKSVDPNTFVENQMTNENIHENLDPDRSVELIINHVLNGNTLAKEHKLPEEIADFIPMHHGTLAVTYFYEEAKQKLGEDKVNIDDFRYPGPKPNTKETALVMLADACESAVRSMSDPDPQKIENIINHIFKLRIDDGQLDESPLTFNDIKKIKDAYLSILIAQNHKRIRYPNQEKIENNSKEEN